MNKIYFKIEGRLAELLGRQAMLNDIMGIFELCKNSYDADASKVEINFDDPLPNCMTMMDDGHGMSIEDIKNKFMVVATSSHTRNKKSPNGRNIVGEKGIGRFAMECLSKNTVIISKPVNSKIGYEIIINWEKYEEENILFTSIGNEIKEFAKDRDEHGLKIISKNLRDVWDDDKVAALNKQLSNMIIPEEYGSKNKFQILTNKSNNVKYIKSNYFDKAPYKLIAKLSKNTMSLTITRKNKKIYGLGVKNEYTDEIKIDEVQKRCGPIIYQLYGYPFDKPGEAIWTKHYGHRFENEIRKWVEEIQGIKIYKDKFRILPYGENDNDWTRRAVAQRNYSGTLPKKHMIGHVNISQEKNPDLIPSATRFHLLENNAFIDLRNFVMKCDKVLDTIMHKERVKNRAISQKNIPQLLKTTSNQIKNLKQLPYEIKIEIIRDLNDYSKQLVSQEYDTKNIEERLMTKIELYRNLASLGITVGMVSHEISDDIRNLINFTETMEDNSKIKNSVIFIRDYMMLVKSFTITLKNDQYQIRTKTNFDLKKEIASYEDRLTMLFDRYGIDFNILIPDGIYVYMYKADLQSIIFNLISNSIKSIIRRQSSMNENDKKQYRFKIKISLDVSSNSNELGIIYSDDGTGVRNKIRDKIFDLFFSDYDKNKDVIGGSGLGLTLIKEIIEGYDGKIILSPHGDFTPGATFLITLKKDKISHKS